MSKRKYPKVQGWWVYSIQIKSNGKYYIGVSRCKECRQRWNKSYYKDTALEPYLNEWDSMVKTVLIDGLNKEDAYKYEDNILRALQMNDLCINTNRSGLIKVSDENAYNKQYYENNKEKVLEQQRQYRKQRYQNDAEYREQEKQRCKQRRLKKKLEKQQHTSVH